MSATFRNLFVNASEGDSSGSIAGCVPDWLLEGEGGGGMTFLYNGPAGMWDFDDGSARHFFDGMSILVSFRLDGQKKAVHFRKKFLKSEALRKALSAGHPITTEYGTPGAPDPETGGIVSRIVASLVPGEMTDNCACSVYQFGSLTVAATETCLLRPFDPVTLETAEERFDLSRVVNVASARPIRDRETGELYNLASTFSSGLKYHFITFPSSSLSSAAELARSAVIHSTIPSRMRTCFSYYHSFAMTERYLIMVEQPWVANSLKLLASKIQGLSFKDCLEWHPTEKNRFHVVEKESGRHLKTSYVTREPFFFLNFVNAFESSNLIVVDLITYDSPQILDELYLDKLRSPEGPPKISDPGRVTRFVLPMKDENEEEKKSVDCATEGEDLLRGRHQGCRAVREGNGKKMKTVWLEGRTSREGGCENPVVNPEFVGRPYRFCYVVGWMDVGGAFANSVSKVDVRSGEVVCAWRGHPFQHPAEPVFVANPRDSTIDITSADDSAKEDSGILVSPVSDSRPDEPDFLLFLDPRTMIEMARANFLTGQKIPFVSHGCLIKN